MVGMRIRAIKRQNGNHFCAFFFREGDKRIRLLFRVGIENENRLLVLLDLGTLRKGIRPILFRMGTEEAHPCGKGNRIAEVRLDAFGGDYQLRLTIAVDLLQKFHSEAVKHDRILHQGNRIERFPLLGKRVHLGEQIFDLGNLH